MKRQKVASKTTAKSLRSTGTKTDSATTSSSSPVLSHGICRKNWKSVNVCNLWSQINQGHKCDTCSGENAWKCIDCASLPVDIYLFLVMGQTPLNCFVIFTASLGQQSQWSTRNQKMDDMLKMVQKVHGLTATLDTKMTDNASIDQVLDLNMQTWNAHGTEIHHSLRQCQRKVMAAKSRVCSW